MQSLYNDNLNNQTKLKVVYTTSSTTINKNKSYNVE